MVFLAEREKKVMMDTVDALEGKVNLEIRHRCQFQFLDQKENVGLRELKVPITFPQKKQRLIQN